MARRPLLPERMTYAFSIMGGLLAYGGVGGLAASALPQAAATAAGIVAGVVAVAVIPALLGRPAAGVILLMAVGGMAVFGTFLVQVDHGLGRALAICVPAAIVLVAVVWAAKRLLLRGQRLADHV